MKDNRNSLNLTHSQAAFQTVPDESEDYQRGYQRGWWFQPEEDPENEEYMKGYVNGWNNHAMDRC